MKTIDLANGLGISTQMTNRLIKQGMPRDLDLAIAWRKSNLEPFRMKTTRIGGNSGKPYQRTQVNKTVPAPDEVCSVEEMKYVKEALTKLVPNIWFGQIGMVAAMLSDRGVKISAELFLETQQIQFLLYMSKADEYLGTESHYTVPDCMKVNPGDKAYPSLIASLNQILSEDNAAE